MMELVVVWHHGRRSAARVADRMRALWRDTNGVTAIEYGLIAAGIAGAIIAIVFLIGEDLAVVWQVAGTKIAAAVAKLTGF